MEDKTMAGVAYMGKGVIKITLGHPPNNLRDEAVMRGYKANSDDPSLYKYVEFLDWGIEVGWILSNKQFFDKNNLQLFLSNIDSMENASSTGEKGDGGTPEIGNT